MTKFTITETVNHTDNNWVAGRIGTDYTYQAKVFTCGSEFGIREGTISKLSIRHTATQNEVAAYDREWDIPPVDELVKEMVEALVEHYHAE